jgi:hypothetical protein
MPDKVRQRFGKKVSDVRIQLNFNFGFHGGFLSG